MYKKIFERKYDLHILNELPLVSCTSSKLFFKGKRMNVHHSYEIDKGYLFLLFTSFLLYNGNMKAIILLSDKGSDQNAPSEN